MDKNQKDEALIEKSIRDNFQKTLDNINGSTDNNLNAKEASTAIRDFTKNQLVMENNTEAYVEFIEKRRQADIAEFKSLEEKAKTAPLTDAEQETLNKSSNAVALTGEEYFTMNAFNTENSNEFIAQNPDQTKSWLDKLIDDWAKVEDKIEKSSKYNMSKEEGEMASSLQVMGDRFPSMKKIGFNAAMFAANPIGFLSSKVISHGIKGYLQTDSGKGLVEKMNNSWVQKFGEGKVSNGFKKGLAACAMVGAVAVLGMGPEDVADITSSLTETIGGVEPEGLETAIKNTIPEVPTGEAPTVEGQPVESTRPDNTPKGAVNPSGDVDKIESTRPDNTPKGAVNPSGDVDQVESTRPDNTPKGAVNPEGDVEPTTEPVEKVWPDQITADKSLELIAKDLLPADAPYSDIKELTMKIADYNNMADADVLMKGAVLEIPTQEELDGIQLKEFKISNLDDLKNLDKIPYGSDMTPDELKAQIKDVLSKEFPDQEMRNHEMMANINQVLNDLPKDQPIPSMNTLDFDKVTETMHGDNKISITDERDTAYDYDFVEQNEQRDHSVEVETDPSKLTSDDQENTYRSDKIDANEKMHQEERIKEMSAKEAALAEVEKQEAAAESKMREERMEAREAARQAASTQTPDEPVAAATQTVATPEPVAQTVAAQEPVAANQETPTVVTETPTVEFDPNNMKYSYDVQGLNGTVDNFVINGIEIDDKNIPAGLKEVILEPKDPSDKFASLTKLRDIKEYMIANEAEIENMMAGNAPENPIASQELELEAMLKGDVDDTKIANTSGTENKTKMKLR